MSKIWRPLGSACLLAASLLITTSALRADSGPSVRVTSEVGQGIVRLEAKASGPFEYKVLHPSSDVCYIDLTGVSADSADTAQVLGTQIVRSFRLEQYQSGAKPVSRLEILMGDGASPKITRSGDNELLIVVSKKDVLTSESNLSGGARVVDTAMHLGPPVIAANGAASIQQISVAKDGPNAEVLVLGSGTLKYNELRLSHPDRLVLDFSGARLAAPKRTPSKIGPVQDVRAGQYSASIARVVIDLSSTSTYSVKPVDGGIAVQFPSKSFSGSGKSALAGPVARGAGAPSSTRPAVELASEEVNARPSNLNPVPDSADPPSSPVPADPQQEQGVESPSQAQSNVTVPPIPATTTSASPAGAILPMQAGQSATQAAQYAAGKLDPSSAASAPATVAGGSSDFSSPENRTIVLSQDAQSPNGTKYTGAPLSVNFKDLDVQDFFRLISEVSGLNVVVDPNVKGTLTIVLNNVPWDQALDIVLMNFDLGKQLDGNVLRIATKETLKKEADENKALAKAQIEAESLVTTTRVLSYAKASDVSATLKPFLSPRGSILADPRTNTLIISDIPQVFPVMDNLLRELDKRSKQVEIEARVVAANRSFAQEIGSQFAFAGSATGGRSIFGGNPNVGTSPITRNSPPLPVPPLISGSGTGTTSSLPLNTSLGATVATSGVSYAFSSANFALDYLISASESKGVGKLLSRPKLITQNNVQAMVEQGTKIPIQTVINNTISVQYIDAVLQLQVTPQITEEGTVFLNVHIENTQIDPAIPRVNGIPALDTQAQNTQVLVNDGQTVMIGGIIVSNQQSTIDEVPYVGSLPIIGKLFQHRTVSTTSQELLFFITPRILP